MGSDDRKEKTMTSTPTPTLPLPVLYDQDENAWLEIMSRLAAEGRHAEMDFPNLSEYLADMAGRDRREALSRLVALLAHLLKWEHQPDRRSGSWQATILEQRQELRELLESGTLYKHAESAVAKAYSDARKRAAAETGLPLSAFPSECKWDLNGLLAEEDDESAE
jgi:hypothetical protein